MPLTTSRLPGTLEASDITDNVKAAVDAEARDTSDNVKAAVDVEARDTGYNVRAPGEVEARATTDNPNGLPSVGIGWPSQSLRH